MKKTQAQQQIQAQQNQTQLNQAQPNQTQGGDAMIYFVTFPYKVDSETAKQVLAELQKRFPMKRPVFTPRIPRGRRMVLNIDGLQVIVTFPYLNKNPNPNLNKQEEGFSLKDLIKKS